ncbi:MAG TPA: iron-sulfur cluster assembly accessory protein [Myxococcales bacterium]|nr:iron-sulfur cluster assembly accessory protein [Myxococcales bacterium]
METTQNVALQTTSPSEPPTPVRLTDRAAAMVNETIERESLQGSGLRVAVVGGGCSGFQYSLDIEKEQRAGDLIFEVKGVRCFVDPMSSMYLMGVEIDYVEGQFGQSGFSFKNPNAKHTCGCGSSFSA